MSAPYARFFTPPFHGGSFPLPRARDVVKTSVFTRPRKRDSSRDRIIGDPDIDYVSTLIEERANLHIRMNLRRFTRLTNAYSKKVENHVQAFSLYAMT